MLIRFFVLTIISFIAAGCASMNHVRGSLPIISLNQLETNYSSLSKIFNGVQIVQLGESIHMTNELPDARIELLKPLVSKEQFDVILFEGSSIEAWLASDFLLSKPSPNHDEIDRARDMAFPPIWRTKSYNRLVSLIQKTWESSHPLYLASYDLQPGMGALRTNALKEFITALKAYNEPSPENLKAVEPLYAFSDRQHGFPNALPEDKVLRNAIDALEEWITLAAPIIRNRYPNLPHDRAAQLIPGQLRRQLKLWKAHVEDQEKDRFRVYQETRDSLGAESVTDFLQNVSSSKKVIVWAHHVHVFHNVLGKARYSLGSSLKKQLGDKVYTVGTFAGAGECLSLDGDEVQKTIFPLSKESTLESELALISQHDFFIDFKTVSDKALKMFLSHPTTSLIEGVHPLNVIPDKDFDGAIFVRNVSASDISW